MNKQGNTVSQKENDNFPETKLRAMENCDINDRAFKIAIIKKLNRIHEIQKGGLMSSGIKLRKRSTLPKIPKL